MKTDTTGVRVNWLKLKWIQVRKGFPSSLFVNYSFNVSDFMEIRVSSNKVRGRPKTIPEDSLKQRYDSKLSISNAKKKDLLSLCTSGTIPFEYHAYYKALPASSLMKDKLPMPAISEDEQDTDEN